MSAPALLLGVGPCPTTASDFAELINSEWRKSVEGIIGAGRRAKQALLAELLGLGETRVVT